MARKFNNDDIEQLKRNVSILHLCSDHGIELKKHGTHDYVGKCPFHDDEKPSFVVTPSKNLWHCLGCDKGGSVIDLIMELEGLTFKQAVDKLLTNNGLIHRGVEPPRRKEVTVPEEKTQQLLERAVTVYEKNLPDSDHSKQYLEHRGITDAGLFSRHRVGYCTGKLSAILPGNGNIREELKAIGILLPSAGSGQATQERFAG